MAIYFEKDDVVLFHGENPSQLLELPDSFVDTIITDPPYGLSFMGKKWDYDVPSIEIWKECLRVLKPGGTALIFAGSRTQHRMAVNVEDAGFILKDCIMWLYGSGFPKATDLSLQFDKKACMEQLIKQLGRKPDKKEFDAAWKVFREVVGQRTDGRFKYGFSEQAKRAMGNEVYEHTQGFTGKMGEITAPVTPEAILWNGWKSHGLKPAYEPILVAMKPNDGTYANNALVHGVSGLNIDGGRILTEDNLNGGTYSKDAQKLGRDSQVPENGIGKDFVQPQGRFPANIILSCTCGDVEPWEDWIAKTRDCGGTRREWESLQTAHALDCPVRMLDEQSGISKSSGGANGGKLGQSIYGEFANETLGSNAGGLGDKGGASRFFYCAKASKAERNAGCEDIDEKTLGHNRFDKCGICGGYIFQNQDRASACKCETPQREQNKVKGNHHPTVKPLALMEYLCTLTKTPTGGIILDPFMGSGTTGVAAKNLGRPFIGIDQDESSCEIAKARIIHAG